jgi:actin-like ATPase involved in cell morphogenesis
MPRRHVLRIIAAMGTYALGIDLGTTFTAAAIARAGGAVEPFALGDGRLPAPTAVALPESGELLVGEAADRRRRSDPSRVAREFKRRLGDPVPLVLGGTPYGADALAGHVLAYVVARVAEREGEPPAAVAVTHPASWTAYKLDLLEQAARTAGLGDAVFVAEPVAAAVHYAALERIEPGDVVAVYDFGGGTFDAAVLARRGDDFELLGRPEGIERLGGIDIDQALFAHVDRAVGGLLGDADAKDPAVAAALARVRDECRTAKEALSSDTEAVVAVAMPGLHTEVRLTRAELEAMLRPRLPDTVAAMRRAADSAGVDLHAVARVLLVGGTSRIPLVAETVRAETGRPVAVDADPKLVVALGAARLAARRLAPATVPADVTAEPRPAAPPPITVVPITPPQPAAAAAPRRRWPVVAAVAAVVGLVAVGAAVALAGGDDGGDAAEPATTAAVDTTTAPIDTTTPTTAAAPTTGAAATTAPAPPTAAPIPGTVARATDPTPCPVGPPETACITELVVDADGGLVAYFTTTGYTPELEPARDHIHFYFDSVGDETNAGAAGSGGDWRIWDAPNPFTPVGGEAGRTGYTLADAVAADATQLCSLVALPDHVVKPGTGNCIDLPGI